jgi:ATP-dependent Clp protease adaptor protein ClpS
LAHDIDFELDTQLEIKEPNKYKVILLNDDYSTIEFVVEVLIKIFKKSQTEATKITLDIHNSKKAICGIYSYEIAQTKVAQVKASARQAQYPLKAILEEE